MRDIKFRYWDKGEMIYGIQAMYQWEEAILDSKNLMQYTGLKDKNDTEIYEGDILREPPKDDWEKINYGCYEVFFHDGDANSDYNIGYSINRSYYHGSVCGGMIPPFKPKQVSKMVIIGNTHQNPELLNQ